MCQQGCVSPHWKLIARAYLHGNLPWGWIRHTSGEDSEMLKWRPRSPDPTPCVFFSLGIREELGYTPLPANANEQKQRITTALETAAQDMLQRVWEELHYRLDVCSITGDAHIERL